VDYQKTFVEQLPLIDRVVQFIARRHHLSASDVEEFTSTVHLKLIEKNFAILRKFERRSNLTTYLTTVVERLYLDFCIARWGKWRPSAAARRAGTVAVELERLMARDGLTFTEAVGILQTNHKVSETREELLALLEQLPVRPVRKFAGEEELAVVAAGGASDDTGFAEVEDRALVERVETALQTAVGRLPVRDQLLIKMHFCEGLSIAQVARALGAEPKPLYRRMLQIMSELKEELAAHGIDQPQVARVVAHPALVLGAMFARQPHPPGETGGTRPSTT
jgi:RNA polymerase sigma factor for flagellar operon FliA